MYKLKLGNQRSNAIGNQRSTAKVITVLINKTQ